ncbi:MAG: hypothetical protein AMXMBFR36_00860 [Acidobacteriota bacterium]
MSPRSLLPALAVTLAALAAPAPSDARRLTLPAPSPGDLVVAGALADQAPAVDADRQPVAVAWPLAAGSALGTAVAPFVAESREHWFRVTAAELEAGVEPAIASRGALLRLSPLAAEPGAAPPSPPAIDQIVVVDGAGTRHRGGAAVAALADAEALAAAGVELPEGSVALRLRAELGGGPFRLQVEGAAASGASGYLVHVFEPESDVVLSFGADRSTYPAGESGELTLDLDAGGRQLAPDQIVGFVSSPEGRIEALQFAPGPDGRARASFALPFGADGRAGLWQAEVAVVTFGEAAAGPEGGPETGRRRNRPRGKPRVHRRTARTAFAVALPTARLGGELEVAAGVAAGGLAIGVPIEVASAGRYAVRGIVAERRIDGTRIAVARAESAAWLEPGVGELRLELGADVLSGAAAGAALELVELELVDPGRLGLLERRALELSLDVEP